MSETNLLAIDIGAGSGRVVLGQVGAEGLALQEIKRFTHRDCLLGDTLYWDILDIWNQVKDGVRAALDAAGHIDAVGIDSFAPDFVCLRENGELCGNMRSYRNYQDPAILEPILARVRAEAFFDICGNAPLPFGLLSQLCQLRERARYAADEPVFVLPLANALEYLLCGVMCTDRTQASVSMLNDRRTGGWSDVLCDTFLRPPFRMPPILPCGQVLGEARLPGFPAGIRVVNVGAHDTAVANHLLAEAARGELCVNAGTWISVGVPTPEPVVNARVMRANLNNYALPGGGSLLCKLSMGMGFFRQLRESIARTGKSCAYEDIAAMAAASDFSGAFDVFDPDLFSTDRDFAQIVRDAAARSGGPVPQNTADVARCLYNGVTAHVEALSRELEACTGRRFEKMFVGGGGVQDTLFLRLLESRTGKAVVKMPVETTVTGNLYIQMRALGIPRPR